MNNHIIVPAKQLLEQRCFFSSSFKKAKAKDEPQARK